MSKHNNKIEFNDQLDLTDISHNMQLIISSLSEIQIKLSQMNTKLYLIETSLKLFKMQIYDKPLTQDFTELYDLQDQDLSGWASPTTKQEWDDPSTTQWHALPIIYWGDQPLIKI